MTETCKHCGELLPVREWRGKMVAGPCRCLIDEAMRSLEDDFRRASLANAKIRGNQ